MNQTRRFRKRLSIAAVTLAAAGSMAVTSIVWAPAAQAAPAGAALIGKTIFLDPGHQGSAAGHDLNKQVPDGRGGKKDCQTTGATAVNGAKEHTVDWDIAQLVKAGLESQGAKVVLSRADDTGWGGCVDERAAAASRSGAAVAVSLHADSTSAGSDPSKKGFHMIVPTLPLPDKTADKVQSGEGRKASTTMRDAFTKAGFSPANYAGVKDGIQARSDIAAVNLTTVPAVFIEMGNLSNPTEATALSGKDGQLKYALAITDGILGYTAGAAAPPNTGATTPGATTPGTTTPGTTTPGTTTPGTSQSGDLDGLASVLPFIQKLIATNDLGTIATLLSTEGQDVASQVLKAMLEVIYGLAGGKLPV